VAFCPQTSEYLKRTVRSTDANLISDSGSTYWGSGFHFMWQVL